MNIYFSFYRDEESKETNFRLEHQEANYNDMDSKSDVSGSTFTRSIESSSSKDLGSTSHPREPGSRVLLHLPLKSVYIYIYMSCLNLKTL